MSAYLTFWVASLTTAFMVRRRAHLWLFLTGVFLFLGLRHETGFDWPVYKAIFETLRAEFSLARVALVQISHAQETAFILILGAMAQLFPVYEVPQAIFSIIFLYSFVKLASAFPGARPAVALAIYLSFYLLPVGFSTVRQTLSISLFNLGLYHYLSGRPSRQYLLFGAAVLIQISSTVYVAAFLMTRFLIFRNRVPNIVVFWASSLILFAVLPLTVELAGALVPFVAHRIAYYREVTLGAPINALSGLFLLLALYMGSFAARVKKHMYREAGGTVLFRGLIVVLAALVIGSSFFSTLRDRVAYELILLFSIYVSGTLTKARLVAVSLIVSFGLVYQAVLILRYPAELAFFPYQNSAVMFITGTESTGRQRSAEFIEVFNEIYR